MMTDHYLMPMFVSGTILLLMFAFALIAYLLVYKSKQNAHQIEKANMLHDHELKILNAHLEEQERVMNHISKELHDNVLQSLTFVKSNYHILENSNLFPDKKKEQIVFENIGSILFGAVDNLRNLSHSLNSNFIGMAGLIKVLEKETGYVSVAKNIICNLQVKGEYKSFEPDDELLIYRITQEAIQNSIKYSEASVMDILLVCDAPNFTLTIADNGVGFDTADMEHSSGIGFLNMKERAKALNGKIDIRSAENQGCSVTLSIPG